MLTSLEKLSLSGNRLESLPQSISQLVNLKELSLSGNTLQELSPSLGELGKHAHQRQSHTGLELYIYLSP